MGHIGLIAWDASILPPGATDLLAQRAFGAARTGSVFAFAPFIGAVLAFAMGDRTAGGLVVAGDLLMVAHVPDAHHTHRH